MMIFQFKTQIWLLLMKKCFTADLHLGSERVLYTSDRPFANVDEMNQALIKSCNEVANDTEDILYHIGDLYCYKKDGAFKGMSETWNETKKKFVANVLPLSGNHDENNSVRTVATSMRMILGGRFNCVLCHFPSYHKSASQSLRAGDINICGHVHAFWPTEDKRYFIDKYRKILNINVGVDVWGYKPITESTLVNYITHLMANITPINFKG